MGCKLSTFTQVLHFWEYSYFSGVFYSFCYFALVLHCLLETNIVLSTPLLHLLPEKKYFDT